MSDEERAELAELDRELTAFEAAVLAWDRYKALRDGPDQPLSDEVPS